MSGLASGTEQNLLNGCAKNREHIADRHLPAAQLAQLMMGCAFCLFVQKMQFCSAWDVACCT
jgi:hypothetical protein